MSGKTHEAILFSKCTGINDSTEVETAPVYTPDGTTDILDCLNLTVTPEGKIVKIPAFSTAFTAASTVDELVAGPTRLLAQAGVNLYDCVSGSPTLLTGYAGFTPGVKAKYITTPLDTRINNVTYQYKLPNSSNVIAATSIGTYTGPVTSKVYNKMPRFNGGFVQGSKLYTYYDKFLQYSLDYLYDLFNLQNDYIGSINPVLDAGQIPGCIITVHKDGVTGYFGESPRNFTKKFYPCQVQPNTLRSGMISKLNEFAHVFVTTDGIQVLTPDMKLVNVTVDNTDNISNTTWYSSVLVDGKYLVYGSEVCWEYDFRVKALMKRSTFGIKATCLYNNEAYFGVGTSINTFGAAQDSTSTAMLKLPFNDFQSQETKQIRFLYFTGKITGNCVITVMSHDGQTTFKDISNIGEVKNYKITGLRHVKAHKIAVQFDIVNGEFKLEELRVAYIPTSSRR